MGSPIGFSPNGGSPNGGSPIGGSQNGGDCWVGVNYGYWIINLHLETFSGPHYQFTHFDFISERVIPKKRIPPQFYVYRQPSITSTANSTPIEISPNGVRDVIKKKILDHLGIFPL